MLYHYTTDIRCDDLPTLANGMTSCSSGKSGAGYEGDTCHFRCNANYTLSGSNNRTCHSDGTWSGIDAMCRGTYICTYLYCVFTCVHACMHEFVCVKHVCNIKNPLKRSEYLTLIYDSSK